jgi:hypothetical protein
MNDAVHVKHISASGPTDNGLGGFVRITRRRVGHCDGARRNICAAKSSGLQYCLTVSISIFWYYSHSQTNCP